MRCVKESSHDPKTSHTVVSLLFLCILTRSRTVSSGHLKHRHWICMTNCMIVPWTWGALTTRGRTQAVHMVALTMCHVSRYRLCMMILLSICRAIGSDGPLPRECEIQVQWPAAHCVLHHVNLRFSKALAHGDFHLYRHTHKHTHTWQRFKRLSRQIDKFYIKSQSWFPDLEHDPKRRQHIWVMYYELLWHTLHTDCV